MGIITILSGLLIALAAAGVVYQAFALMALHRYFPRPLPHGDGATGITILKPLYGAEPRLAENLTSFLAQDYAGPVQILLATNRPDDPAAAAVQALLAAHPQADIAYHPGPRLAGANAKMGSCAAALPLARHPIIVLSDSDMVAPPDYLSTITAALAQPDAGAVSCLYVGRGDAGFWSRLGAAMISAQSLPNMVVGITTGMAQPCMGSTIALRAEALRAIGGFAAFADVLADDHAMGAAIRARGQTIAIPPMLLIHAGAESSSAQLWHQHLRWAATIRDLAGAGHYGSLITHALPLAIIAALVAPMPGLGLLCAALALRLGMAALVSRLAPAAPVPLFLVPLADIFAFAVFCGSLITRKIDWRGTTLTMQPKGRIAPLSKES